MKAVPRHAFLMVGLFVIVGLLTLYPVGMLLYGSFHSAPPGAPGGFNLDGYAEVLSSHNAKVLVNTIGISLSKTLIALVLAVILAWIVARTDTPFRAQLEILITLPFFIPPILTAVAWGMLGNPSVGLINQAYKALTGSTEPLVNIYSYGGVVWHMTQYSTAFLFLFIVDIFRAMDPSLEESSRMSGASPLRTFMSINLLLMLPALTNAFILSFIRGIESFESPLFFGSPAGVTVITTEIYDAINHRATPDYQYATALSIAILCLMFVLVILQRRILGSRRFSTVTGKGYSPKIIQLGKWRWLTFGFCMLFFIVTVLLPVGQLIVGSFFRFLGFYGRDALTLDNYRNVFANAEVWRGFRNTLMLGFVGASLTMSLGGLVAYVATRTTWRGRRTLEAISWLPWMMPGMVLGIGFLWAFAMLPGPVSLYGTTWALLIAYIALGTPLSVRVMNSAYAQLSYDLEECSRVHGATFAQTFWRILVALAWPSFAVGWVLTFFGIMRELSASVLLYSAGSEVLSVVLLKMWTNGLVEQVSVIGLLMMCLVIVFRWLQYRLLRRQAERLQ